MIKYKPLIIGIAGGTGSGKTTIANFIRKEINPNHVLIINQDSYYKDRSHLSFAKREKINYDHPNSLETNILVQHLKDLIETKEAEIPKYDFETHTRKKESIKVFPKKIIIVEGMFVLADLALIKILDIKIFIDTDDDIRLIHRIKRDKTERNRTLESIIQQYLRFVKPMHIKFVKPSKKYADIIIPRGHNPIGVGIIISMIKEKLLNQY